MYIATLPSINLLLSSPRPVEIYIDIMRKSRPSAMMRKLLQHKLHNALADPPGPPSPPWDSSDENPWPEDSIRDEYCFLYGTLMDPDTLSKVLGSSIPPLMMRPARVIGYQVKLWGPYPALLDDKPLHPVVGMVCGVLSPTQLDRLAAYETDKYHLQGCLIDVLNDDGSTEKTIEGVSFMWNGRQDELREGTFDLKQWRKERQLSELEYCELQKCPGWL
ncbi:uncharacterized protein N7515_000673 [Penicillium bovifimosum]|uniref:Putative gamma-glutamylcyclotransferase n=1 Tax=Penicillium bovifimosum TaxID=126998 RepID=A0A9W9LA39_9EURO|nr:uncharacterized protein N7515_000673 [Penicillium bovifimosum]KAJ5146109.1 hypothetical protein N7515_000673 [Penicillium bovifimosum]